MFIDLKYLIWDMYYLIIDASLQILEKWKLKKWFPDTRLWNFCYSALRMRVTHHSNLKSCINSSLIDELIIESYFISKKFIFDWIIWNVISVNDTILIPSKYQSWNISNAYKRHGYFIYIQWYSSYKLNWIEVLSRLFVILLLQKAWSLWKSLDRSTMCLFPFPNWYYFQYNIVHKIILGNKRIMQYVKSLSML